jgi:hypothetical protein
VIGFGYAEDLWFRPWNIPMSVNPGQAEKSNQSVPHKSDSATLRRATEKGDLNPVPLQGLGVFHRSFPRPMTNSRWVLFEASNLSVTSAIHFYLAPIAHLDSWLLSRTKEQQTLSCH